MSESSEVGVTSHLSPAAAKVQAVLQATGVDLHVIEVPHTTRTAVEAAGTIGCEVGQIVKSLVFKGKATGRPILVIASGSNRVSESVMAERSGEPIEKANAEFVRRHTGFAIGGIPPLGHSQPLETYIDEDLLGYAEVWAAAGTPFAVFRVTPAELVRITQGCVMRIK